MPPPTAAPPKPRRCPEISLSSVVFGVVVGAMMNAAITYAGLKIGFTIVGSAIVAVLGFGVLRGILRRGSILEVNIAQTLGTAVNCSNAGIIFTVPVLLLLGQSLSFNDAQFWWLTLAAMAGAILGVVFIVPMRAQMIDIERLRFPSGTAVASILRSPGSGSAKTIVLAIGILIGAVVYLPVALPQIKVRAAKADIGRLVAAGRLTPAEAERAAVIDAIQSGAPAPADVVEQGRLSFEISGDPPTTAIPVSEQFARAVYLVSAGGKPADSLARFWPRISLPGYGRLGWRAGGGGAKAADGTPAPSADRDRDDRADLILTNIDLDIGRALGIRADILLVFAITPLSLGAGFVTGRNGLVVLAGGLLVAILLNPISYDRGWLPPTLAPHEVGDYARNAANRPLGIGLLLGGAATGIFFAIPALREVLRGMIRGAAGGARDDLAPRWLLAAAAVGITILLIAAEFGAPPTTGPQRFAGILSGLNPILAKAIIVLVAAAWIWFAGIIISQCTGMTDWTPLSGMALLTVVLVMLLGGTGNIAAALILGVALGAAISLASDMMTDLKTGHLVGSLPRRQQIVNLFGAALGPVITMSTIVLIANVNLQTVGVPLGVGTETPAPQAETLRAVITGVQGGEMPYALYGLGAGLGTLLGLGAFPGLGVLIGLSMFLPTKYVMVYGLGCLANMVLARVKGQRWTEDWGVPFCAGLIVGEAMLALAVSSIVLARG